MAKRAPLPAWFPLVVLGTLAANVLAGWTTSVTIDLMRGTSEFARTVRAANDLIVLPYYQLVAYTVFFLSNRCTIPEKSSPLRPLNSL